MIVRHARKAYALLLALMMFAFLAGCTTATPATNSPSASTPAASTPAASTPPASAEATVAEPTQDIKTDLMAKYDPPIEVTGVRSIDSTYKFVEGESIENNIWIKTYEDKFGIKLKYLWVVDGSQFDQKMNIAIASNELPDIMRVEMNHLNMLVENDSILPLDDLYDKWSAVWTKERMTADGGVQLDSARFGEKLMAIPWTNSALDNANMLWIRADWLKTLGLSAPKTMDDVIKISQAFTKQDPDQNGKDDTFGLAVQKELVGQGGFASLYGYFNGYHAYTDSWIKGADGKLVYGGIQPEIKTALIKLQEMYADGQIDTEFGVKDSSKVAELTTTGKAGMQFGQMWTPLWPLQDSLNADPKAQWEPYAIPSADDKPVLLAVSLPCSAYYCVNKNSEHPEALFKLLNFTIDPENGSSKRKELGSNDQGWEIWKYAYIMTSSPTQNLDQYRTIVKTIETGDTSLVTDAGLELIYDSVLKYKNGDNSGWGYTKVFAENSSQALLDTINTNKQLLYNEFYGAPTKTMSDKWSTLQKMQLETYTKIIMGTSPDEFDSFVQQWKSLGGDTITAEVNDWYDKKNAK